LTEQANKLIKLVLIVEIIRLIAPLPVYLIMKLCTILSVFQLGTAVAVVRADDDPVDFGRSLHVDKASIKRLRDTSSKASKVFFVAEEIKVATELAAEVTSDVATKTGKTRGFNTLTGKGYKSNLDVSVPYLVEEIYAGTSAKAPKVLKSQVDYFSYDYVPAKSAKDAYFSYDYVLPNSDKDVNNFSYDFFQSKSSKAYVTDFMSYDFAGPSTDADSMSFDFAGDQPPFQSPTLLPTASWIDVQTDDDETNIDEAKNQTKEEEPALDNFGRLVFE
jgi:hypothetical protein